MVTKTWVHKLKHYKTPKTKAALVGLLTLVLYKTKTHVTYKKYI